MVYDGPQTDWGKLDATHPPQRNKANHFAGPLTPDEFTLDSVESPRNSNWFLVLTAARRAVTFLEQQPEADPSRIGAYGHSMGGKLTTDLAGIEPRIKAAVPSCGGAGRHGQHGRISRLDARLLARDHRRGRGGQSVRDAVLQA
jgi:dienelactone hydrolase